MLDVADGNGQRLSNLALQKLLYFAHATFLIETGTPLVSGFFEAWKYGPVHPIVYRSFRSSEGRPIKDRAMSEDPVTGELRLPTIADAPDAMRHVRKILALYGTITPGRLVDITHAPNAPWHYIVNKSKTSVALGLRIPDNVIRDRFKFHKVTVSAAPRHGEPDEDSPIAGN
nr:type II toxin-antitoxin system antitoxin SocA domain-containing protein [Bradyrhizobium jicamae]